MTPMVATGDTVRDKAVLDTLAERDRQLALAFQGDTNVFDMKKCTANDWVGFVTAYNGRAARKVYRNQRENATYRENMIKVAATALAAIEAYDRGWTPSADEVV